MSNTAIRIDHVSKEYRLGAIGGGTLRGDLQTWLARKQGKEDPNSIVGTSSNLRTGERFLALDDISFDVSKGEALGIIGHNGAGKSTLLKLLSRVTAPTKGTISYNGRIASMLEVGTGFHPELTGRENVYMNGAILGMSKAEISKKFDQIVQFAEMEKFIDTPVKRYSSGMYVKLAFAVAAHLDSEIMIMDEVLAVGDMKFQQKCLGKMGDASRKENRTILYVSHNMNTIRQLCKRVIVLDHGRLIYDGPTEDAISLYMSSTKKPAVFNDCSNLPRTMSYIDHKIHINTVTLLNTETAVYSNESPIDVSISYSANAELSKIAFRMTVESPDKTVVGLATSKAVINSYAGKNKICVSLNHAWLAPGKYIVKLTAYSVNEYGTNQMHDIVEDAFAFEKEQVTGENNNMEWNHSWWGYMKFPDLTILTQQQ